MAALLVSALAAAPAGPPAGAQGYDTPTITVTTLTCPDDTAYGDDLAATCRSRSSGADVRATGTGDAEGSAASGTTGDDGVATLGGLVAGGYDVSDAAVPADATTLVECRGLQGFGGFVALPVTAGDHPGAFSVDLTYASGKVGLADACTVYVLPAAAGLGAADVAGLALDSAVAPADAGLNVEVVPPDGTRSPLSGAGPATPARQDIDYTVSGDALAGPLGLTTPADAADDFPTRSGAGPVLLPPGDYTVTDTTRSLANEVALAAGGVTHVVAVGPDDGEAGTGAAPPDGSRAELDVLGRSLAGAWTELDQTLYGDEAAALYGVGSGSDVGTLIFDAGPLDPGSPSTLSLLGLDDELPGGTALSVTLNGTELFRDDSPFPDWDPEATGNQWGTLALDVAPGLLRPTGNRLVVSDLAPDGSVGQPPWVMVTAVTLAQSS